MVKIASPIDPTNVFEFVTKEEADRYIAIFERFGIKYVIVEQK